MSASQALSLTPYELNVRGRAMELDPNWCRLHYLLAVLIHRVDYFIWGFLHGGKGKPPADPVERVPWIKLEKHRQELDKIEMARNSAAIDQMVHLGEDETAPAGEGG